MTTRMGPGNMGPLRLIHVLSRVFFCCWLWAGPNPLAAAVGPSQIVLGPLPSRIQVLEPLLVEVQALDGQGGLATNDQSSFRLWAFLPQPDWPVISEVNVWGELIEISNPGTEPFDMSGWEVIVSREEGASIFKTHARVLVPPGSILPAQGTFTIAGKGVAPGTFPALVSTKSFHRGSSPCTAVRLLDPTGVVRDELNLLSNQSSANLKLWQGSGVKAIPTGLTNVVHSRIGLANHFRNADWVTNAPPSPRVCNAGLQSPWQNRGDWTLLRPDPVTFNHGIWSEFVVMRTPAQRALVVAENGAGLLAQSTPLEVWQEQRFSMVVPPELRFSSEATAGQPRAVKVVFPAPLNDFYELSIQCDAPQEFSCPSRVPLEIGMKEVSFLVTNLDDAIPDGEAQATLTVSLSGSPEQRVTLWNADNESGQLRLVLPTSLPEGQGSGAGFGGVWLDTPAAHDVRIELTATPPLEVPPTVIIPAGRSSIAFAIGVGDDALANPLPWRGTVTASTGGWPAAAAQLTLVDDEDRTFTLEIPNEVVEGIPARGIVHLKAPHVDPLLIQISHPDAQRRARLGWPLDIVVPAGVLDQEFTLSLRDNTEPEPDDQVELTVLWEGRTLSTGQKIFLYDDDAPLARVDFGPLPPRAVLSGQPFAYGARLSTVSGSSYRGSRTGLIDLLAPPNVAVLAGGLEDITFTNGVWRGIASIEGAGMGLTMRVRQGDLEGISSSIDVLRGKEHDLAFQDIQWWSAAGRFLVLEPAGATSPARLSELEPLTGTRGRSLELPQPANLLALADGGTLAWVATTNNLLLRVDLPNWKITSQSPLLAGSSQAFAQSLLPLPGQPEELVAVVVVQPAASTLVMQRYRAGQLMPANASISPNARAQTHLQMSPDGVSFWCLGWGGLCRFLLTDQGLALERTVSAFNASNLQRRGDWLIASDGRVWSATTGADQTPFPSGLKDRVYLPPGRDVAVFAEPNGILGFYDLASRERLGSFNMPVLWAGGQVPALGDLCSWGATGIALLFPKQGFFQAIEDPLVAGRADLEVTMQGPPSARLSNQLGQAVEFNVQVSIINRGPDAALGVVLRWSNGTSTELGTLAPDQRVTQTLTQGTVDVGLILTRAFVRAVTLDPVSDNDGASLVTAVDRQDFAGASHFVLGAQSLLASSDGSRLFAALSPDAGAVTNGIAVIDPKVPRIERILGTASSPGRVAVSENGQWLFASLTNRLLARWDLATGANDLNMTLPNEPVSDVVTLPGWPRSIVVAIGNQVMIYDDASPRPATVALAGANARLGFASGLLWIAEPTKLSSCEITAAGLTLRRVIAWAPPAGFLDFHSDGRRLFFIGGVFDTETFTPQLSSSLVQLAAPDPTYPVVYMPSGNVVRRIDRDTLVTEAEQLWPSSIPNALQDLVRWGEGGLAARSGPQVIVVRTALVPAGTSADLAVTITPSTARAPAPSDWIVSVTNLSDVVAPRVQLRLRWDRWPVSLDVPGQSFVRSGNEFVLSLGDVGPHQTASQHLIGTFRGFTTYTLEAQVYGAGIDPVLANNASTASQTVDVPHADLGIVSVTTPPRVAVGDTFLAEVVVTNAGPEAVHALMISTRGAPEDPYLLESWDGAQTNSFGGCMLDELLPGASKLVNLQFRARRPGLVTLSAACYLERQDANTANDSLGTLMLMEPVTAPATSGIVFPSSGQYAWDRQNQKILAAFPSMLSGLAVLDPTTLIPTHRILVGEEVTSFTDCQDGQHAWLLTTKSLIQVNYQNGETGQWFPLERVGTISAMASPKENPNLLIVVGSDQMVRVCDQGQVLPEAYGPVNNPPHLFYTSDARLWFGCGQQIRELQVSPTGVSERRNLDTPNGFSTATFTEAGGHLFASDGRVFDIASGQLLGTTTQTLADIETGLVLPPPNCCTPVATMAYDAATLDPRLNLALPAGAIALSLGSHGFLMVSNGVYRVAPAGVLNSAQTDLSFSAQIGAEAPGVGIETALQISVTNRSAWAARDAQLHVALSPGLALATGQPGAGSSNTWFQLGSIVSATNLTVRLIPLVMGPQEIVLTITNQLPDLSPTDNAIALDLLVPDLPLLLIDDMVVLEDTGNNSGTIQGVLSRPAPTALTVPFVITPVTAQSADFRALSGTLSFAAGDTRSTAWVVYGDALPEPDETATIRWQPSAGVQLTRTETTLTIRDNDLPIVTVGSLSLVEGQAGITNAIVRFGLNTRAPYPVEVWFRTSSETALANQDYLPRESWLTIAPGETNVTVSIPILGDTEYEPSETFGVNLLNLRNATAGNALGTVTIQNDDPIPSPVLLVTRDLTGVLTLEFPTLTGVTYFVQTRTNLSAGSWTTLGSPISGTGLPRRQPLDAQAKPSLYYRVRAQ